MSLHYNNRTNQIEAIGTAGTLVNFTGLGINNLVEDTTPQLGGDLDMNGNNIEGVTPTEMGYLSGVTSAIQTQLNGKAPTVHTHTESDITDLGSYLENVVEDTTPQLGADLDVNGHTFNIGASTGAANQVPTSNGAGGLSWAAPQVVADTTPQLGGDLDMNSNNITAAGPTTISPTEVSYLDGATSNIQSQLDALAGGGGGTVQGSDATYDIQAANEGTVAGNARGENSVDLQTDRNNVNQVASATWSVICGGARNRVDESYSSILGGFANYIAASSLAGYHVILGGSTNTISATTGEFNAIVSGETNQIGVTTAASDYCFIGSGQQHTVDGNYGVVCGGINCDMNTPFYGFHGNGSQNNITSTGDFNTILNGFTHDLTGSGDYGLILQGNNNQLSAYYSTVINGINCTATANGALVAGNTNDCASSYGVCFGSTNDVGTGGQCSILGGSGNDIFAGNYNVICGGTGNVITTAGSDRNFIGAGGSNQIGGVASDANAIVGGNNNDIGTTHASFYCFIGSGNQNLINADYASVVGGLDNEIQDTGDYSAIVGGQDNILDANYGFIGVGSVCNIASGCNYTAIPYGRNNNITSGAHYSQATGWYAQTYNQGQRAHASGRFAANGDAQTSDYVIRRALTHTSTTWLELTTDGLGDTVSNALTIPVGGNWTFDVILVGSNDAQDKTLHFQIKGGIKNVGGTVTLKSSITDVIDNADDTLYEARAIADTANDALRIEVRRTTAGSAPADAIRWVAHVRVVEVIY